MPPRPDFMSDDAERFVGIAGLATAQAAVAARGAIAVIPPG